MTARDIILQLKSDRFSRPRILAHFVENNQRIEELIFLATNHDEHPVQEHASWILIHACEQEPLKLAKYQAQIIDGFFHASNQTTLRNLCNCICKLPLIEYKEGELLDCLISHFKNVDNKVALHVYSLHKINQFIKKYPEIKPEIAEILALKKENGLAPSMVQVVRNFNKLIG